ncbi:unnamed protein product, partial [Adineta ricciae]
MIKINGILLLVIVNISAEILQIDLYPGYGWDHLRFLDMLPIFDIRNSYNSTIMQQCITHIPLRQSEFDIQSQLIDLYNSSTTTYELEINLGGEIPLPETGIGIGGSFSPTYQDIKSQQGRDNTITLRNVIRHDFADVLLLPSCSLDSRFKSEIIQIANYIKTGELIKASYAAQMLILRYGTHYTNRIRIGGQIIQDNFIRTKDFYTNDANILSTELAAKLNFLSDLGLSF